MTQFIEDALYRVIGNNPSNPAGKHHLVIGEIVRFVECVHGGEYKFEALDGSKYQWILPEDVVPVDVDADSLLIELETIKTEVAALRTQIEAALAVKPAAEEVFKPAEPPHVLAHRALMEWAGTEWEDIDGDCVRAAGGDEIAFTSSRCDAVGHRDALVRLLTAVPDLLELATAVAEGRHGTTTMSDMAKGVLRKAGAME